MVGATLPYVPPFELQVPWIPEGGEGTDDPESGEASDVAHGPRLERRRPDMSAATLTTFVARSSAGERDSRPGLGAEPVFGCGQIHEEPCCQPFKLLFAAFAGCRECVRASVEREHVDPAMLLQRGECNVLAWAVWGAAEGHDAAWVQGYLAGKGAAPRTRSFVTILGATGSGIGCGLSHTAACSPDHLCQPYKLFSAAHDGCRECVRAYVEDDLVNPRVQSQSGRNALSWALWGAANEKDTSRVQGYLEALGVTMPHSSMDAPGAGGLPEVLSAEELDRVFGVGERPMRLT